MSTFPTATVADMRTEHLPALRRQIEIINEARTKGQPDYEIGVLLGRLGVLSDLGILDANDVASLKAEAAILDE